jgi:hypothetical protein
LIFFFLCSFFFGMIALLHFTHSVSIISGDFF